DKSDRLSPRGVDTVSFATSKHGFLTPGANLDAKTLICVRIFATCPLSWILAAIDLPARHVNAAKAVPTIAVFRLLLLPSILFSCSSECRRSGVRLRTAQRRQKTLRPFSARAPASRTG